MLISEACWLNLKQAFTKKQKQKQNKNKTRKQTDLKRFLVCLSIHRTEIEIITKHLFKNKVQKCKNSAFFFEN